MEMAPLPKKDASPKPEDTNHDTEDIWKTFVSYSTLHGFHFTFDNIRRPRQITWILLMLFALAFLVFQAHSNWKKLLEFDVTFSTDIIQEKSMKFPAVSICNQNMMRKSKILNTEAQKYLDELDPVFLGKYSKDNISSSFDVEEAVKQYGHNLSEVLIECKWLGVHSCDAKDFVTFLDFRFGLCYTFNSRRRGSVHHVTMPGPTQGLSLLLDAQPEEYYGPFSYEGTGYKILIHDQKHFPVMDSEGIDLKPGFHTNIRLRKKEVESLPPPYKNKCGQKKLKSGLEYSLNACYYDCYTLTAIKACNCRVLGMSSNAEFNKTYCTPSEIISCIFPSFGTVDFSRCDCPNSCNEIHFETLISSAYFPSQSFWSSLLPLYNLTGNDSAKAIAAFQSDFRRKAVKVNVFFESLSKEVVQERPSYTISDLAGDFGGNMGLFLGCSLLTLCEFVDVFILICLSRWKRKRNTDCINPVK